VIDPVRSENWNFLCVSAISGTVDWDLIREQWDQMVRVAVALK
jgi:TnpA family transposase